MAAPLDTVVSVTGAWSLSRNMLTSFGAGTRYTKSGTAIITLEDQSGNNRDFTDGGVSGRRPTEATAFPSNVLCADFNGTSHYLTGPANSNFVTAASGAIVVSVIIDAVTTNNGNVYLNHGILCDPVGQYVGLFARNLSGVTLYGFGYDGASRWGTQSGAIDTAYVLMWRHHGGNLYFSVNGGTESSSVCGNIGNLANVLSMGMNAGSTFCNMKIAEAFTTNDGSQTAALAAAVLNMKAYTEATTPAPEPPVYSYAGGGASRGRMIRKFRKREEIKEIIERIEEASASPPVPDVPAGPPPPPLIDLMPAMQAAGIPARTRRTVQQAVDDDDDEEAVAVLLKLLS